MKGGLALKLSDSRYASLLNAFKKTFIPIPSQKRNICVTDATSVILWYADGLRSLMWEHFVHGKEIQTDCDVNFTRLTNDEILDCWIKTTGLRIANILTTHSILGLKRQRSFTPHDSGINLPEGAPPTTATGELCSMMYHTMYYNLMNPSESESVSQKARNEILTKTDFVTNINAVQPLIINKVLNLLGVSDDYKYSRFVYSFGRQLIAIELQEFGTGPNTHVTTLCKVHGHWHYMNDEIGYSLPIKPEFDNDELIHTGLYLINVYRPETNKSYTYLVRGSHGSGTLDRDDDESLKRASIVSKTGCRFYKKIDKLEYEIQQVKMHGCIYKTTPLTSIEPVTLETSDPWYDELMRIETGQGGNTVTSQGQGGNTSSSTTTSVPTSVNNTDAILNMFRSIKIKGTGGRKRKTLRNKKNKYKKTRKSRQVED